MKYIGIVGSRRRSEAKDYKILRDKLVEIYVMGDSIVSGGCRSGADNYAESIARDLGITIIIHNANWSLDGKRAGHIRNQEMANQSDILIALPSADRTGGTESTIEKYLKTGKDKLVLL